MHLPGWIFPRPADTFSAMPNSLHILNSTVLVLFCLAGLRRALLVLGKPRLRPDPLIREATLATVLLTAPAVLLLIPLDPLLLRLLQGPQGNAAWHAWFLFWSEIGDGLVLFTILVACSWAFAAARRPDLERLLLLAFVAALFSGTVAQALKHLFFRTRPGVASGPWDWFHFGNILKGFTGNPNWISMPSGHTAAATAAAFILAKALRHPLAKAGCFLAASLVGLGRVHLAKHWFTDVVAGLGIGLWAGFLLTRLYPLTPPEPARPPRRHA